MNQKERGLTLVEVLATLTIFSIVSIIIWSVFFQGLNFSQKAVSKNLMVQETNILISNLTKIHQTSSEYKIMRSGPDNCEITVTSKKRDKVRNIDITQPERVFGHSKICFDLAIDIKNNETGSDRELIKPINNDVSLTITTKDKNKTDNKVTTDAYLYRLKGVGY